MLTPLDHPKRRGEWVELQFAARAAAHGLNVSKPWGDSCRYDFIVERNGCFYRVQVKSTRCLRKGQYLCWASAGGRSYDAGQVDFLAVYIIPEELWYILPVAEVAGRKRGICLAPHRSDNRYWTFLEAWHLLVPPQAADPAPIRSL